MALTTVEYTYSGQTSFVLPFTLGVLNRTYVTIQINNQVDGSNEPLYYTDFTWLSDGEIEIHNLTNGDLIKIARVIPSDVLLSDYTSGSNITRDNLDIANKQLMMLIHELKDEGSAQGSKLDTIEPNAKDDQTPAEIKTAYESIADTNAFTDADESKLDGIESGADVTDTSNVTAAGALMDSEVSDLAGIKSVNISTLQVKPSEGAFVDGDKTKLNTIETNADVTDTANVVAALTAGTNITIASDGTIASTATGSGGGGVSDIVDDLTPELGGDLNLNGQDITGTGNITITGTVNTRDMAADGTKLDAIEAGATADQTAAQIKTAYESNVDTNAFTNADRTKLDGIEASATADQTKADIDALNIDADTLDGQHGAHYLDYNNLVNTPTIPGSGPSGYATESYVDTSVANIIDSAPGTLDTLNELAQALGDDPNFATTTATNLSLKLPKAGGTMTGALTVQADATFTGGGTGSIVINDEDSSLCPTMTFLRNGGGTTTNDFIKFENSGGEVATIDSTGGALFRELKVKGSNTRRIDISNTTLADTGEMATLQWDNSANLTIQGRTSAGVFAANWYSIQTTDTDGRADAHIFYTDASTERMRINSTGVGIGTSSPTSLLHLASTAPYITFEDTDNNQDWQIQATAWFAIRDQTSNAERMRIDSSGNVGVGHTSPVAKMAILGSSNSTITEANSNLCVEGSGGNGMLFGTLSTSGFKSYIQSGFVANLGLATYDLLLNPEGGNVGVGTSAPSYKIDVRGAANSDVAIQVKASGTGDVDAELRLDAADTGESVLRMMRDGVTRAISEYTNSDEWNFTTYNNDKIDFQPNSTNAFRITDSNVYSYKTFNAQDDIKLPDNSQIKIGTGDDLLMYQDGTGSIIKHNTTGQLFFMGDDIRFVNQANNNAIMYLTNDVIQFHGNSKRVDNTHSYFGTGNDLDIYHDGSNSWIRDVGTGALFLDTGTSVNLYANGNTAMLQASAGAGVTSYYNGVGKFATTASGAEVLGNLDVDNALNVGGASPVNTGFIESTVVGPSRALQTVGNVNTTQTHIGFENLSGEVGRIDVDVFSVSYVTSSDYRLKTDIVPIAGSIDRLKDLKPCNFQWIGTDSRVDGFIAHEAQEVVPEAVSGTKDATKIDKDGTEVPDYQGIDQAKLVPLLTAALQEAVAKIEAAEDRIQSLETQMLTLQLPQ